MNMSKSVGLRPTLLYKSADEQKLNDLIKNVVVPSSMRSPLWQYFGFPADKNREILTRSKIVCCICRHLIAYNKNTTNLSTHLTNKHPEIWTKIKNGARRAEEIDAPISPKRKMKTEMTENWYSNDDDDDDMQQQQQPHPTGITLTTFPRSKKPVYKSKFQITEDIDDFNEDDDDDEPVKSSFDDITEHEHADQFQIETIDYATIDGNEIIDEVLVTESAAHSNRSKHDFLSPQYITINGNNEMLYESSPKKLIISSPSLHKPSGNENNHIEPFDFTEIMEQMKKFLIRDLITPSIVNGSGFKEMITFFSHSVDIPDSVQVNE